MRIDFFFLWKQGRRHQISPYQIYVYYEKEKKKKRSYQIYVYNEIEKRKEKKKRNDRVN